MCMQPHSGDGSRDGGSGSDVHTANEWYSMVAADATTQADGFAELENTIASHSRRIEELESIIANAPRLVPVLVPFASSPSTTGVADHLIQDGSIGTYAAPEQANREIDLEAVTHSGSETDHQVQEAEEYAARSSRQRKFEKLETNVFGEGFGGGGG